eukprot:TRINITY_DN7_c0_g2_i1.p1 TRINITY_DN7_c0_g2~~TRINITY_DN7_c0_g2_i1.p1  ORF type:complete len:327 (-),score=74.43 TRINITY_DN7_c0_g2_i1:55-1035(-)
MAVRVLTSTYVDKRSHHHHHHHRTIPTPSTTMSGAKNNSITTVSHPRPHPYDKKAPSWQSHVDAAKQTMMRIHTRTHELDEIQRKHLLPRFGSERELADEERSIQRLSQDISVLFRECHRHITNINSHNNNAVDNKIEPSSHKIVKKNAAADLAIQLQEMSVVYRKQQTKYVNATQQKSSSSYKARIIPSSSTSSSSSSSSSSASKSSSTQIPVTAAAAKSAFVDLDSFDDDGTSSLSSTSHHQLYQSAQIYSKEIDRRDQDIQLIATSINDLAVLFNDLALLTHEQGAMLDVIEDNIEKTDQYTSKAVDELGEADHEQKKMCIIQ